MAAITDEEIIIPACPRVPLNLLVANPENMREDLDLNPEFVGGTLSVLAAALKAWICLPRRSDVRLKVQGADGSTVEIDAKRVSGDQLDALVEKVLGSASSGE